MFGKLQGHFVAVGASILAVCACEASGYHGAEYFGRLDARTYRSTGMMLLKDKLVYSWEMTHKRSA
jgi:hypothetical protein